MHYCNLHVGKTKRWWLRFLIYLPTEVKLTLVTLRVLIKKINWSRDRQYVINHLQRIFRGGWQYLLHVLQIMISTFSRQSINEAPHPNKFEMLKRLKASQDCALFNSNCLKSVIRASRGLKTPQLFQSVTHLVKHTALYTKTNPSRTPVTCISVSLRIFQKPTWYANFS